MNRALWRTVVGAFRRATPPLAWYYAITLALPLANGAARAGGAFLVHALVVLVLPPALIVVGCVVYEAARALAWLRRPTLDRESSGRRLRTISRT